jgi:hypothetical protein
MLNKALASAFQMIEYAHAAIGDEAVPPPTTGDLWWFPDAETRDLVGRVFGDVSDGKIDRYRRVKRKSIYARCGLDR